MNAAHTTLGDIAMTPAQAGRRYLFAFFPAMTLYIAAVYAMPVLLPHFVGNRPLLLAIATLPALPVLVIIYVAGRFVLETDEYQRALATKRMLFALGGALAVCTVYGFMEVYAATQHFPLYLVFPLYCLIWALACAVIRTAK
jgi:hypothetical protein